MRFLVTIVALLAAVPLDAQNFHLARFSAEVTPPIGHACMGGGVAPVKKIDDPLYAHGFVLLGGDKPVVVVAIDWCEIRNDAYERWRTVLAEAAGTDKKHVLVVALHQHDTPIADLEAQRMLSAVKARGSICDLEFHEQTVQRVARALKEGVKSTRRVTHVGTGQAKVKDVASNRRYIDENGKPRHNRMSRTADPKLRAYPDGIIDPWLKTLSFWDGDEPLLALNAYATHPMSYYGGGAVSADFIGLARKLRQADDPKVLQIYASGCSGNVTAGKYNDGDPKSRVFLAERLHQAMTEAWKATKREPLKQIDFASVALNLEPRASAGFSVEELKKKLEAEPRPTDKLGFQQCLAAMGLSWRKRLDAGLAIDVSRVDLGAAQLLLLPAESYVEYQLYAQKARPDGFVVVMGYGESAPGYIPTDLAFMENDSNLHDWCWVAPGSEKRMHDAIDKLLKK